MKLIEYNLDEFTEKLASREPVPGGGGASALIAALGIALGNMVGSLTVGKKKFASIEPQMLEWMDKAEDIRKRALELIDGDAEAFMPLAEVYRMPKDDPEREEKMEAALYNAASVPMKLLKLCGEAIDLLSLFADNGSKLAISDAATGAVACKAALEGAWINLKVNTSSFKNREVALKMEEEALAVKEKYTAEADSIYERVMRRIG
ncbi:MAG: cyclodeaminase/cyclohydrolase family protein [Oscillospiraceae bacterium]|nr:cyclodeaminase/cyclohydrolase family protein [Oscillospiraceae bacterium]